MAYTHLFKAMPLQQIIDFANKEHEGNFKLKISNYSANLKAGEHNYLFSDDIVDTKAFRYFQKMKKELAGELREIPQNVKYHDFSGLVKSEENIEELICIDISSAYLTVLRNEKVISEKTFNWINTTSTKNKKAKTARLKSVGMFAKNPMSLIFEKGEIVNFEQNRDPFAWVFFLACLKTGEAMELCKKELGDDFLFYWVDGIFFRNNTEKIPIILEILSTLGFKAKLENVENLRKSEKTLLFNKDGKEKILFLPQTNFEEMKEIKLKIGKYRTL
jgi:hypothetical protein